MTTFPLEEFFLAFRLKVRMEMIMSCFYGLVKNFHWKIWIVGKENWKGAGPGIHEGHCVEPCVLGKKNYWRQEKREDNSACLCWHFYPGESCLSELEAEGETGAEWKGKSRLLGGCVWDLHADTNCILLHWCFHSTLLSSVVLGFCSCA